MIKSQLLVGSSSSKLAYFVSVVQWLCNKDVNPSFSSQQNPTFLVIYRFLLLPFLSIELEEVSKANV